VLPNQPLHPTIPPQGHRSIIQGPGTCGGLAGERQGVGQTRHDERERQDSGRSKSALRKEYGALYDRLAALLFKADPVGIGFEDNTDEYEPEVGSILPRLRTCASAADVQRVVHEEFCRWFDSDTAGPFERYRKISDDIWIEIRGTLWAAESKTS